MNKSSGIRELEFIALMAFLMSNVALCIDTILPALTEIGNSLEVANNNYLQLVIIVVFMGLGVGELLFGTLSDSVGRKPIVFVGVGVFVLASFLIVWAPDLKLLLAGRFLQGFGLSAARSISIAIIRDTYKGDRMARIMSFIMTIFILIPMVAPLLGQTILDAYDWKAIFYFQLFFIGIVIIWFWLRQRETLSKEHRIAFSKRLFTDGLKEYIRHKKAILYTLTSGLIQGAFIAYLGSSQQIFQVQYQKVEEFPYIFGGLAIAVGVSSLLNGSMVLKYGMLKLIRLSLFLSILSSSIYLVFFLNSTNPTLVVLIVFLAIQFLTMGFTFGNLSALAMEPIGHIAGIGAALFNFMSMTVAVAVAVMVGMFIQGTVIPLFVGFFLSSIFAMLLIKFAQSS
ncbi:MAG: multidrug effflux MFS transporter [Bacteroidota bacterium]